MPKYFIKTYGCQMNINDSEVLAGLLEGAGYKEASSPADSDVSGWSDGDRGIGLGTDSSVWMMYKQSGAVRAVELT